ncbi:hypothetical protein GCM10007918_55420 [Piscinibacter gummiphilus]|nr:hypothetical protein GCM10007918_55420 [Piscinibacter gummiphilus]
MRINAIISTPTMAITVSTLSTVELGFMEAGSVSQKGMERTVPPLVEATMKSV